MNVDQYPLYNLSLCSGGGGLDLGLELALGNFRTVCWVEWEAFAINYLVEAMEAGCLAQAPVYTDCRTFDGEPWRGVVDFLTAGYPCQPFSIAGKRRGEGDPRHLWPHVCRIIGEVEPTIVFLENVPGHLSLGFEKVAGDLQAMDYEIAAGLFTAEEVGANHKRERLFILALAESDQPTVGSECQQSDDQKGQARVLDNPNETLADSANDYRWRGVGGEKEGIGPEELGRRRFAGSGEDVADAPDIGLQIRTGNGQDLQQVLTSIERSRVPLFPPGPGLREVWRETLAIDPSLEPAICRLVDGMASHRLRLLGNGVVPLQAAYAFISLWSALRK